MATTVFATTQQLRGLIVLNWPSHFVKGWHSTLLAVAITAFVILWNTVFVRKLPLIEGIGPTFHIFGFFAFFVVLWVMGPLSNTETAWTRFGDNSG
jgi:choline transport protein